MKPIKKLSLYHSKFMEYLWYKDATLWVPFLSAHFFLIFDTIINFSLINRNINIMKPTKIL